MAQSNAIGADLRAEGVAIAKLGGTVLDSTDIGAYAVELAINNWAVGPLCKRDRKSGRMLGVHGKDPVGHLVPHGVFDFTTDIDTVVRWWSQKPWNIGARVPESMFVLDIDNLDALTELEAKYGRLPETLTTISGRSAGGRHHYFRRPLGRISQRLLPNGIEIKTSTGYVVQPPSIHPDSGKKYTRVEAPVAAPPAWLVNLLLPEPVAPRPPRRHLYSLHTGPSVADEFAVKASWATILGAHGWHCLDADPEADGARWLHPAATSAHSATIRHGLLFVYSPNTPFELTESGHPKGYTKFRAFAVLDHGGDMSAAAKALRAVMV